MKQNVCGQYVYRAYLISECFIGKPSSCWVVEFIWFRNMSKTFQKPSRYSSRLASVGGCFSRSFSLLDIFLLFAFGRLCGSRGWGSGSCNSRSSCWLQAPCAGKSSPRNPSLCWCLTHHPEGTTVSRPDNNWVHLKMFDYKLPPCPAVRRVRNVLICISCCA